MYLFNNAGCICKWKPPDHQRHWNLGEYNLSGFCV